MLRGFPVTDRGVARMAPAGLLQWAYACIAMGAPRGRGCKQHLHLQP